jgi:hypothetical protein
LRKKHTATADKPKPKSAKVKTGKAKKADKPKKQKKGSPEHDIQKSCVEWFRTTYPDWLIFSVPNEATFKSKHKYKESGVLSGITDLVLVTDLETVYIEMKSATGRCSKVQKEVQEKLKTLGHKVYVCRSLEAFKVIVNVL